MRLVNQNYQQTHKRTYIKLLLFIPQNYQEFPDSNKWLNS